MQTVRDDAEMRATTLLISIFGYDAFLHSLEMECMEQMISYVADELMIVAKDGFSTFCAAPDCNEMDEEAKAKTLPGMIVWRPVPNQA